MDFIPSTNGTAELFLEQGAKLFLRIYHHQIDIFEMYCVIENKICVRS